MSTVEQIAYQQKVVSSWNDLMPHCRHESDVNNALDNLHASTEILKSLQAQLVLIIEIEKQIELQQDKAN